MRISLLVTIAGLLVAAHSVQAMAAMSNVTINGDNFSITCVADPHQPQDTGCHACLGPGETQSLPVERQGDGYAIGVPDTAGIYMELDPVRAMASC